MTSVVPVLPKAGEVYVYSWNQEGMKDKWRIDHHRWRNNGTKRYPAISPVFTKYYHVLLTDYGVSTAFQRVAYLPLDPSINKIIIHYIGDETLSKPVEKLRSPKASRPPKVPQTLEKSQSPKILGLLDKKQVPKGKEATKRKMAPTSKGPTCTPHKVPAKPSRNQSDHPLHQKFGWIVDLRDLAFELETFVKSIKTVPEFICVMGSEEMLQEFDRVLDLDCTYSQLLSYNSVYLPGGYFVSTLMFRHLLFEGSPFMPIALVLHKNLTTKQGDGFLSSIIEEIPRLKSLKEVIAVDPKIALGVEKCLPMAKIVYSWNHIRRNAKTWMAQTNELFRTKYMNELVMLLEAKSETCFDRQLETLKLTWGQAWSDYFSENLERDIRSRAGRWKLEELNVYSSYTGVTPSISNPYETVMTALAVQESSNIEATSIVLALDHLHSYFITQIRLAQTGQQGQYSLRKEFREIISDPEDVIFPEIVISPDKIVPCAIEQIESGPPFTDPIDCNSYNCFTSRGTNDYKVPDSSEAELDKEKMTDTPHVKNEHGSDKEPFVEQSEKTSPSQTVMLQSHDNTVTSSSSGCCPVSITYIGHPANKVVELVMNSD